VAQKRHRLKQTYDFTGYFFGAPTELLLLTGVERNECIALPASLPERVDPVHETCAGLVCPGG
jgi:hypothetical protein